MLRALLPAGLILLLGSSASTQDPGPAGQRPSLRKNAVGEVRAADGKPWVGARVFLQATAPARSYTVEREVIETATDQRGRFRAAVLVGQEYRVWARTDVVDGRYRASGVESKVIAGEPVLLEESSQPVPVLRLTVTGREAWEKRGELHYRVVNGNFTADVVLDEQGQATLPPPPGSWRRLRVDIVRDGERHTLCGVRISTKAPGATMQPAVAEIPAPKIVKVAVWSFTTGRPIEGAEVHFKSPWDGYLARVGVTDARGVATAEVAYDRGGQLRLFATKKDHVPGMLQPGRSPDYGKGDPNYEGVEYHAQMEAGASPTLRVSSTPGAPVANLPVLIETSPVYRRQRSSSGTTFELLRFTDDNGELTVPPQREWGAGQKLRLLLPAETLAKLPWEQTVTPAVAFWVPKKKAAAKPEGPGVLSRLFGFDKKPKKQEAEKKKAAKRAPVDLDIVLSAMCPVEIRVTSPSGAPASRAMLRMYNVRDQGSTGWGEATTDRRGRVRVLFPDKHRLVVSAGRDGEFGCRYIETRSDPLHQDKRLARLDIPMRAPLLVKGHIVAAGGGKGVAGASIRYHSDYQGREWPGIDVGAESPPLAPAGNAVRQLTEMGRDTWPAVSWALSVAHTSTKSGDDGSFELRLPDVRVPYAISASSRSDRGYARANTTLELEGKPVEGVVIELNK